MPEILDVVGPNAGGAPLAYTLDQPGTVDFQAAFAHYDGTGASGNWRPTLTIKAQDGTILSRTFPGSSLHAGDTADVTFSPFVPAADSGSSGGAAGGYNSLAQGLGLVAWTIDPAYASQQIRPSTTTQLAALWLDAGTVITSMSQPIVVPEATPPVHAYMALYNSTFSLVAQTPDTPSLGTVAGWNTVALTTPYTVPTSAAYFAGAFYDAVTNTPTTLSSIINWTDTHVIAGQNYRSVVHTSGYTSPPNTFTVSASAPGIQLLVTL